MHKYHKKIGDNKIIINCEEGLKAQVDILFKILEEVADKIQHDFSVQVGWSVYFLHKVAKQTFVLKTFDFDKPFPALSLTEDLTKPIWVQMKQASLMYRLGLPGQNTRCSDRVTISRGVLDSDQDIYFQRTISLDPEDSGWFIGYVTEPEGRPIYESVYAFEILKKRPELVEILALPYNYLAVVKAQKLSSIVNQANEVIYKK